MHRCYPCEFTDHLIVTSATTCNRAAKFIHRYFKNGSCIIRLSAYQRRINAILKSAWLCTFHTGNDHFHAVCIFGSRNPSSFSLQKRIPSTSLVDFIKHGKIFIYIFFCQIHLFQFFADTFQTDLIHLQRMINTVSIFFLKSTECSHRLQNSSVVDTDGKVLKIHLSKHGCSCQDQFDLCKITRLT